MRGPTGRFEITSIGGEEVRAFIPNPLPPDPPLSLTIEDAGLLEKANRALGRLDGFARLLPDPTLFVYGYIRREAVLSSQIEGTQSSLSDLLLFENQDAPGVPDADVREVLNYVTAMERGLDRLKTLPLSIRLFGELHIELMQGARGGTKAPGELRRTQNWIGGSRPGKAVFVPPPPHHVMETLGALEMFLHNQPIAYPTLIKAALAHVQFETIHPYLDGNGRLGRLLITFLLCSEGALEQPLLYLSLYFKTHREEYYSLLQRVRTEGVWEEWLQFFLRGVHEVAESAQAKAAKLLTMFDADRRQIEKKMGRKAGSALRVHGQAQRHPFIRIPRASRILNLSKPTIADAISSLIDLGILSEAGERKRNRMFVYSGHLRILNEDT